MKAMNTSHLPYLPKRLHIGDEESDEAVGNAEDDNGHNAQERPLLLHEVAGDKPCAFQHAGREYHLQRPIDDAVIEGQRDGLAVVHVLALKDHDEVKGVEDEHRDDVGELLVVGDDECSKGAEGGGKTYGNDNDGIVEERCFHAPTLLSR